MKRYLLLFVLLVSAMGLAQNPYAAIDRKMDEMPQNPETSTASIAQYINYNFTTSQEKIRAAFYWTATNIDYEVDKSETLNYNQDKQEKIDYALRTHTRRQEHH